MQSDGGPYIDWPGALLVTLGLGSITFALIEWPSPTRSLKIGAIAAIAGLVSLAAFIVVEISSRAPMVDFALFRSRNFTGANLLTLFLYCALGGLMFFFPMDLIQVQHYTATQAGAAFLPFVAIMFGLSRWASSLVERFGSRLPLTVGPLIAACGIAGFALGSQTGTYWLAVFPAVAIMGLGMAISVAPLTTTVMNAVPATESGLASGINNAVSRLAALLAVAVFGVVLTAVFNRTLDHALAKLNLSHTARIDIDAIRPQLAAAHHSNPAVQQVIIDAFLSGYRTVIWIATALAVLSSLTALAIIKSGNSKPAVKT